MFQSAGRWATAVVNFENARNKTIASDVRYSYSAILEAAEETWSVLWRRYSIVLGSKHGEESGEQLEAIDARYRYSGIAGAVAEC
jgi:hypothetical protein